MSDDARRLTIGEVASCAGMSTSRIRYYESRGVLPEPGRVSGKRRYSQEVLRRLAIIDAAQRVGFTLDEIGDLLGSRDAPAHERLRRLAELKLPEIDGLIERATAVRGLLEMCRTCDCETLDVCGLFDDRLTGRGDEPGGVAPPRLVVFGDRAPATGLPPVRAGRSATGTS